VPTKGISEKPFKIYDDIRAQLSLQGGVKRQEKDPSALRHRFFPRFPSISFGTITTSPSTYNHLPDQSIQEERKGIRKKRGDAAEKEKNRSLAIDCTSRSNASSPRPLPPTPPPPRAKEARRIARFLRRDRFRFLCEHVHGES
jgi:hypothetical protein